MSSLRITSPITRFANPVPEKSTRQYEATLVDHAGVPLDVSQVLAITLFLLDVQSGIVIRYFDSVLNENGGTLAANGKFTMIFNEFDTEIQAQAGYTPGEKQERLAQFSVDYNGGHENHEVRFFVQDFQFVG